MGATFSHSRNTNQRATAVSGGWIEERRRHLAKDVADDGAKDDKYGDDDNGHQYQDQGIFDQALSFLMSGG
jgi:cytochrome P450